MSKMKKRILATIMVAILCLTSTTAFAIEIPTTPTGGGTSAPIKNDGDVYINWYWDMTAKEIVTMKKSLLLICPENNAVIKATYPKFKSGVYDADVTSHYVRTDGATRVTDGPYMVTDPAKISPIKVYGLPWDLGGKALQVQPGSNLNSAYWKIMDGTSDGTSAKWYRDEILNSNYGAIWAYNVAYNPFATTAYGKVIPRYRGFSNIGQAMLNSDYVDDYVRGSDDWGTRNWIDINAYRTSPYSTFAGFDLRQAYTDYYQDELDAAGFTDDYLKKDMIVNPSSVSNPGVRAVCQKIYDSLDILRKQDFSPTMPTISDMYDHMNPLSIYDNGFAGTWYGWHLVSGTYRYFVFSIGSAAENPEAVDIYPTAAPEITVAPREAVDIPYNVYVTGAIPDAVTPTLEIKDITQSKIIETIDIKYPANSKNSHSFSATFDNVGDYQVQLFADNTNLVNEGIESPPGSGTWTGEANNIVTITIHVREPINAFAKSIAVYKVGATELSETVAGSQKDTFKVIAVVGNSFESTLPLNGVRAVITCRGSDGKYHSSYEEPVTLQPGQTTEIIWDWDRGKEDSYTFEVEINPAPRNPVESTYDDNKAGPVRVTVYKDNDCFKLDNQWKNPMPNSRTGYPFSFDVKANYEYDVYEAYTYVWYTPCSIHGSHRHSETRYRDTGVNAWDGWHTYKIQDVPFTESLDISNIEVKGKYTKDSSGNTGQWQSILNKNSPAMIRAGYGFELRVTIDYTNSWTRPGNEIISASPPWGDTNLKRYTGRAEIRYDGDPNVENNTCLRVTWPDGEIYYGGPTPAISDERDLRIQYTGTDLSNRRVYTLVPHNTKGILGNDENTWESKYYLDVNTINGLYEITVMTDRNGITNWKQPGGDKPSGAQLVSFKKGYLKVQGSMFDDLPAHEVN